MPRRVPPMSLERRALSPSVRDLRSLCACAMWSTSIVCMARSLALWSVGCSLRMPKIPIRKSWRGSMLMLRSIGCLCGATMLRRMCARRGTTSRMTCARCATRMLRWWITTTKMPLAVSRMSTSRTGTRHVTATRRSLISRLSAPRVA